MATKPKAMTGTGVLTTVSQFIINSYENRKKSYNRLEIDAALMTSLTMLLPLQKQTTTAIYKILIKWSSMNQTGLRPQGPPRQVFFSDMLLGWTDKFEKGKVAFRWNHIRRVSFFVDFFNFKDGFMYSSYGYN